MFNPVGVGELRLLRPQGAPPVRRPWALLFYAFGVTTILVYGRTNKHRKQKE